jgi:hypothetical protein
MGFDFDKTADEAAKSVQDNQPPGDAGGGQGSGGASNLDDLENLDDSESQAAPTLKGKAKSRGTIEDVRSWAAQDGSGVIKILIDVLVTESDAEDMVGTEHTIWCCVKGPAKDVTRGKQDLAKVCRSAGKPLYNNSIKRCGNDEPLSALVGEEIGFSLVAGKKGGIFCNP